MILISGCNTSSSPLSVIVYDLTTQNIAATLSPGLFGVIWAVAYGADDKEVAFGGTAGIVYIYSTSNWKSQQQLHYYGGQGISCIAFSPIGNFIAAGGDGTEIDIWNQGTLISRLSENQSEQGLAFSHDAKFLLSGNWDHKVRMYKANGSWVSTN